MWSIGTMNRRTSALTCVLALWACVVGSAARAAEPIRIAVFDLEFEDRSANILGPDERDVEYQRQTVDEARRMLAASGRYTVLDTAPVADEMRAAGGPLHCNGCEAPLALKLGADQAMVGLLTRVSRTEYTLQLVVRDARTGAMVSQGFTGLRMGANYSWPRGMKWLMTNRILPALAE